MLQLYRNQDCIELIVKELEINPTFLVFSHEERLRYFLKIDQYSEFIKYYYQDSLAGFISCYCNNYESRQAFVTLVLVSKQYRGLGAGKKLFLELFQYLKNSGFLKCTLEVRSDNINALNLYRSLGFNYSHINGDNIVMNIVFGLV